MNYVNKLEEKERVTQNRRGVSQYSLDGKIIKLWSSIKLASEELNIRDYNILQCCKKKMSSYCGYIWRFSEEYSDKVIQVNGLRVKIIYQYDGNKLVKIWSGIGAVSKFVEIERKNLSRKLRANGMIILGKYTWSISEL